MIRDLKILLGKDGFRKNDLLFKLGLKGLMNDKVLVKTRLKKDEVLVIKVPKDFYDFKIRKWNFNKGDIVDYSDIVCLLENEKQIMEFESFYLGEIYYTNNTNLILKAEDILFKIKGI